MTKITYIEFNGTRHVVDVPAGLSLMKGAVRNNIPGIDAECGGACSCATCQVYIEQDWLDKVGRPNPGEMAMLEFADNVLPSSRLSCQILVSEAIDGLVVSMPETQG
jgi:2Fe-2S ferredoxin